MLLKNQATYGYGYNNLPIPAMAYFINDLDIQSSGHGRGGPTYSKVGDVLYKICPYTMPFFQKKSHPKRPAECPKLCLYFWSNQFFCLIYLLSCCCDFVRPCVAVWENSSIYRNSDYRIIWKTVRPVLQHDHEYYSKTSCIRRFLILQNLI